MGTYVIIIDNDNINRRGGILGSQKADLILHPARLQILMALAGGDLTTQEIAAAVSSVPKPSIYRHLRLLLEAGLVEVVQTRPVKGVAEKVYRLAQAPHLGMEDLAGLTREEFLRYFASYTATLLQGFADYVAAAEASPPDMLADRAGYTETVFYATPEELDQFGQALNAALVPLLQNEPAEGRHRHKLAVITHPLRSPEVKPQE